MDIKKKTRTETKVILELEEWEARDLKKILARMNHQPRVSKSEFSLREKIVGRKLLTALRMTMPSSRD